MDTPIDHRQYLAALDPKTRVYLTQRSDVAGLWHLAGHLGLILGLGALIALGVPGWPLLMLPQGILIAFLFTLQHECTHKTPFETPWLNEAVGHGAGFLIFQPFLWFRAFHFAHHRHTNDPEHDPELAEPKPKTWRALVWHLGALNYWRDKFRLLALLATNNVADPFVAAARRPQVAREARIMVSGYGAALWLGLIWPELFFVWILPLAFGFPVLRLYLLAEHGGCDHVDDMFRNTRTVFTNSVVRFVGWNMPYHTEHHIYPGVPFHRLPELHRDMDAYLKVTALGYRSFARDYAKSLEG
ncbi:MAG: fatty acid desaturase [Pseudomonadota bacterium]